MLCGLVLSKRMILIGAISMKELIAPMNTCEISVCLRILMSVRRRVLIGARSTYVLLAPIDARKEFAYLFHNADDAILISRESSKLKSHTNVADKRIVGLFELIFRKRNVNFIESTELTTAK